MMKKGDKIAIGVIVGVCVLLLIFALAVPQNQKVEGEAPEAEEPSGMDAMPCHQMPDGSWMGRCTTKEFVVQSFQFGFDPATITVDKGDLVKITFTSRDVAHGVSLPDFGVVTGDYDINNPGTLEFIADKAGTFTYFCNVYCGHGHGEMTGQIVVNE